MTEPDTAAFASALAVLLHGLAPEQRANAAGFLLDEVERLYGAAGVSRPLWLDDLRHSGNASAVDAALAALAGYFPEEDGERVRQRIAATMARGFRLSGISTPEWLDTL